jgi:hypothetical protein
VAGDHPTPSDDERLAERGRALVAEAVAETQAPLALRERLAADRAVALRRARRWSRRLLPVGVAALAAAVVAIVVSSGGDPDPSFSGALALGDRPPAAPPPAAGPRPGTLRASVGGVVFPDWSRRFSWPATGFREDRIDGRTARTVFYRTRAGGDIAYTIVNGPALAPPAGGAVRRVDGVPYRVLRRGGEIVVAWEERGHTCVLSAPGSVPAKVLVDAAAWEVEVA